jgi:hypothetical protein
MVEVFAFIAIYLFIVLLICLWMLFRVNSYLMEQYKKYWELRQKLFNCNVRLLNKKETEDEHIQKES